MEREQIDSQRSSPGSSADDTGCSLRERKQDRLGLCSEPVLMGEEISLPQRVCRRPWLGASFLGVLHPHAPPREHWSYTHCILGRPMAAASSHLHASQCLSIPPTLPCLLLESTFAARAVLWGSRRLAMLCLFSSPSGR